MEATYYNRGTVPEKEPEAKFRDPRVALNRIYTRRGDTGETALAGGKRVPKDSRRIEAYGTVDELNAAAGLACATAAGAQERHPAMAALVDILKRIQHELFNLGSILATPPGAVHLRQPRITAEDVEQLEREIDAMNEDLPPLRSFVLPGGCRLNAELHVARTICRRAERLAVSLAREEEVPAEAIQYLNRLSDALFVYSRWASKTLGADETLWEPNRASGAR
jgi:cob(I)alamin adenosyltransferase